MKLVRKKKYKLHKALTCIQNVVTDFLKTFTLFYSGVTNQTVNFASHLSFKALATDGFSLAIDTRCCHAVLFLL